jgi:uncharacterized membrane protein YeaQ/YmgE (transglycosylase-associated protein family)
VTPLWNVLLPVLIGGAIGIVGSFVGPFFLQRLKDATEKNRIRAEKFEALVGAVTEHYHLIAALRFFAISGQGSLPTLSAIIKIEAIVSTYFPEFEGLVRQFDSSTVRAMNMRYGYLAQDRKESGTNRDMKRWLDMMMC